MCLEQNSDDGLPDRIFDTSTLTLTLDNMGMAILQYVMLLKSSDPITTPSITMNFNGGTFKGFLESDSPRQLEGTDYYEHAIIARGMVCD